jgi:hypothetical protein
MEANIIDQRAALGRSITFSHREAVRLHRLIRRAIRADRKRRTEDAGKSIEDLSDHNKLQDAWRALQAWYKHAGGRASCPSKTDLQKLQTEYSELLANKPSTGEPIPIMINPYSIDDSIPTDTEIGKSVGRIHTGRSPGPTGIRAGDLKKRRNEAWREESPVSHRWDKVVELIQHIFETGCMPT